MNSNIYVIRFVIIDSKVIGYLLSGALGFLLAYYSYYLLLLLFILILNVYFVLVVGTVSLCSGCI